MRVDNITVYRRMASALVRWNTRRNEWAQLNHVVELVSPKGSRKTTFLLDFFQEMWYFYFFFEGLEERIAQKLLGSSWQRN